jgi:hypothetical protein
MTGEYASFVPSKQLHMAVACAAVVIIDYLKFVTAVLSNMTAAISNCKNAVA